MGHRVECEITEVEIDGRPGVAAECLQCNHVTESFGTSEKSIRRCLVLMREECPCGEDNFYVDVDED